MWKKSFNITEERTACLEALFTDKAYLPSSDDDASTVNMAERYQDIVASFPDEIKSDAFPYFIDWMKYNVIMVEIIAYSDENAYTIFETMNDRGLNLNALGDAKGIHSSLDSMIRAKGSRQTRPGRYQ